MSKESVKEITDAIGAKTIQEALGVTSHSVRYARTAGIFPASWYRPILSLCREREIDCPMSAFNWRDSGAA